MTRATFLDLAVYSPSSETQGQSVGSRQKARRKLLKTFVAPFISTRLTTPWSPRMYIASGLHLLVQPNPGEQTSHKPIENRRFSDRAWFDWHFASCKGIQDSLGFWIPCRGFRIPVTGFQSLVGFRILWAVFWIPKPRIPDSTSKNCTDSGIRIPLHGLRHYCRCNKWYLQCTESDPASEVAEPMLLFATHVYCPLSDRWTFCIVKEWTFPEFDSLRSESAAMLRVTLSFVQSMLGSGFPSAVQLKIAVSPSIFTVLKGCLVNPGASGREKVQGY